MSQSDLLVTARTGDMTCVPGVEVGHWTDLQARTGCSVVVLPPESVGAVDIRGGAPATHEIGLLDPCAMQPNVDAFVISGGSTPGLACVQGVVKALRESGRGFPTDQGPIPLVPAAALFDLSSGQCTFPSAADGQRAFEARHGPVQRGRVGAGTGAMVGKVRGHEYAMEAGLGQAGITFEDGLTVAAMVAMNALGDVVHPRTGKILAGARDDVGGFLDSTRHMSDGATTPPAFASNTVLSIVVTNALLTKPEVSRIARMAQCGVARTVSPCATSLDGDVVFAAGTGQHQANVDRVGLIAAEVLAAAALDAVASSTGDTTQGSEA